MSGLEQALSSRELHAPHPRGLRTGAARTDITLEDDVRARARAVKHSHRGFQVVPNYLDIGRRLLTARKHRGNRAALAERASDACDQNKGGINELARPSWARPSWASLFDPARGALAQNFQYGGYCHEDGPCHDSMYFPDISGGDFARAETAIVNAVQRFWRWLTPAATGGWQRFLPEAAKRVDAAKAKYGAEGVLNMAKKADIKQIDRIVREIGLSPGQREIFHEELRALKGADGLGAFDDFLDLAREIKQSFPGK